MTKFLQKIEEALKSAKVLWPKQEKLEEGEAFLSDIDPASCDWSFSTVGDSVEARAKDFKEIVRWLKGLMPGAYCLSREDMKRLDFKFTMRWIKPDKKLIVLKCAFDGSPEDLKKYSKAWSKIFPDSSDKTFDLTYVLYKQMRKSDGTLYSSFSEEAGLLAISSDAPKFRLQHEWVHFLQDVTGKKEARPF